MSFGRTAVSKFDAQALSPLWVFQTLIDRLDRSRNELLGFKVGVWGLQTGSIEAWQDFKILNFTSF